MSGGAASSQDASSAAEDLNALLALWNLQSYAAVFVELGVERVSDLFWVVDTDVEEVELPKVARRKMLAMLESWRKQNATAREPAQKRARVDQAGEGGNASGVGGIERGAAPAPVSAAGSPAAGAPLPGGAPGEHISLKVKGGGCTPPPPPLHSSARRRP